MIECPWILVKSIMPKTLSDGLVFLCVFDVFFNEEGKEIIAEH